MNRRIFLRGLGGACVAAPFLSSLGGRGVKAQAAPSPKRLIIMFTHYGCITTRWFPTKSHGALTADDLTPTTLEPLAAYVHKLLMPRGIHREAAEPERHPALHPRLRPNRRPASGISYSAAKTPYPGFGTPLQAFSVLTGLLQGTDSNAMTPDTYQAVRGQSILDPGEFAMLRANS